MGYGSVPAKPAINAGAGHDLLDSVIRTSFAAHDLAKCSSVGLALTGESSGEANLGEAMNAINLSGVTTSRFRSTTPVTITSTANGAVASATLILTR